MSHSADYLAAVTERGAAIIDGLDLPTPIEWVDPESIPTHNCRCAVEPALSPHPCHGPLQPIDGRAPVQPTLQAASDYVATARRYGLEPLYVICAPQVRADFERGMCVPPGTLPLDAPCTISGVPVIWEDAE